ncbi:MAG: hypothetical protein Q7V19_16405 [Bacteroidales bacterium]|nr:hypothetical protein [Bacteroidales bacterium]
MVYLKIKENSEQARLMIEYLKTLSFVQVLEKNPVPNATTLKAIQEVEKGELKRFKSVSSLMQDLKQ